MGISNFFKSLFSKIILFSTFISFKLNFEICIFFCEEIVENNISNAIAITALFFHLLILASNKIFSTKFSKFKPA